MLTQTKSAPDRWVADSAVPEAVESLQAQLANIAAGPKAPPTDWAAKAAGVERWTKIAIAVALVLIPIPFAFNFIRSVSQPGFQITGGMIGRLACGVMLVGGFIYFVYGRKHGLKIERIGQRDLALRELVSRTRSLRLGDFAKITGASVGTLPWLASEMDTVVECDLYGSYRGHSIALLRCTYVVDTSLTALEGSVGKLAASVMSHVQHERVRRQQLEAIVFLDAAPGCPDIFLAARKQPLVWYFKRAFQAFDLNAMTSDSHWLAGADAGCCRRFFDSRAGRLFAARPNAILQVLDGHVVVIPHTWDFFRPEMATDVDQLRQNLDWACDLYETLAPDAMPASEPDESVQDEMVAASASPRSRPAARPDALIQPPQVTPSQPVRSGPARRIAALTFGFIFFLAGGIVSLAMLMGPLEARRAAGWPTVEGRIVKTGVDVREGLSTLYSPNIEYDFTVGGRTYQGRRIAIGPSEKDPQRANIETVLAKYPVGQAVTVHYDPARPADAVLEPRVASAGVSLGVSIFSAALAAVGLYLLYRGFRRPRLPKPAAAW